MQQQYAGQPANARGVTTGSAGQVTRESRPTAGAASKPDTDQGSSSLQSLDAIDDIARHLDGTLVVIVARSGGRSRRRCFL